MPGLFCPRNQADAPRYFRDFIASWWRVQRAVRTSGVRIEQFLLSRHWIV